MISNETIDDMITRFIKITNGLSSLSDSIDNDQKVRKVICTLPQSWEVKSITLKELNDKEEMNFIRLINNLKTHEMERKVREDKVIPKKKNVHSSLLQFFWMILKTLTKKKTMMKSPPS